MEGQPGDNFYPFLAVRPVCLMFCYSQTVFRMLIPEINQNVYETAVIETFNFLYWFRYLFV
jgi:hypothetical protein